MTDPSPELLAETLGATLEEAAFIFAEPEERPAPFPGAAFEARIGYRGPASAELRLVADAGLAATLAANLLGEDEGDAAAARSADAIGELLNMVVGAWVVRLFGEDARCALGVPRVRPLSAAEAAGSLAGASCAVHLRAEAGRRIDIGLAPEPENRAP